MKLHRKLLLVFLPLGALSTAAIAYYSYRAVGAVLLEDLTSNADNVAQPLLPRLAPGLRRSSEPLLLPTLEHCMLAAGARYAAAISSDGRIVAHTDVARRGERVDDAFTSRALAAGSSRSRVLVVDGAPILELSIPVPDEALESERYILEGAHPRSEPLGLLRLGLPLEALLKTQKAIAGAVVTVAGGTVAVTLLALLLFTRWLIVSPLAALARAVERFGRGESGARAPADTGDELGELGRRFNEMSEELARTTVSKERLSQILEQSIDGVLVVDAGGRISAHNSRFAAMWGVPPAVLLGGSDELALRHALDKVRDPAAFMSKVRLLYAQPELTSHDELALVDGRTFDRYSAPIIDPKAGYRGRVWYFRDVTDRKKAEEAEALRERERIQRDFIASVSHDLRTPITAIKGFAETLLTGGLDDPENGVGFIRTIERNADRLAHLVDNLLTISVLESGRRRTHPEPLELRAVIGDLAGSLDPLVQRSGLSMRLKVEPGLTVLADAHHLSQVLQNLIDNAVKFSSWGGVIEIEAARDADHALVSVRDRGCGIEAKDLARVFERFQRGDGQATRKTKGSGLGLSIVKQLVELQNGRVWAESEPGRGTTVRFTLPLA